MTVYKQNHEMLRPFTSGTKMSDIISANYSLLLVITRFGIPLGFGEKNVGEICKENQVDETTLLCILNVLSGQIDTPTNKALDNLSLEALILFLRNSHTYFLAYKLPSIREQLMTAISNCPQEVAFVIRKFFDEYVDEVHKHMSYEDKTVFPYARALQKGEADAKYRIEIFKKRHDQIELKITELKNILIKYYPAPSNYHLHNVLHEIFASENDLASHNFVEDNIFIPFIERLEKSMLAKSK